jgi:hypothetical protein
MFSCGQLLDLFKMKFLSNIISFYLEIFRLKMFKKGLQKVFQLLKMYFFLRKWWFKYYNDFRFY